MKTASVDLTVISFEVSEHFCGECSEQLEIHQPLPADPDRFLGTCSQCGSWYAIYLLEDNQAIRVVIPKEV